MSFIIANIKLLIEISEDGNYKIHENRTHFDFQPCDELPPIRKKEDGENIMQSIIDMVSSSSINRIKWASDEDKEDAEEDEDVDEEVDDGDEEVDEDDEDEDNTLKEDEDEDEDEEEKRELEKEKEKEIKVYNSEINIKPNKNSSTTTTLKNNYVKKHITRKQR